jgi:tRNA threonylcarbamoyladenosine biosynthesis protein TsaB
LNENSFAEELDREPILFVGDGVAKWAAICQHPNARFLPGVLPRAEEVGELAWQLFEAGEFVDLAYWTPNYLKASAALTLAEQGKTLPKLI